MLYEGSSTDDEIGCMGLFGTVLRMVIAPPAPPGHGRYPSIPSTAFELVFRLNAQGHGCRSIVRSREADGVFTTKSSVHRLIHGQAPYQEANDGR